MLSCVRAQRPLDMCRNFPNTLTIYSRGITTSHTLKLCYGYTSKGKVIRVNAAVGTELKTDAGTFLLRLHDATPQKAAIS